jgi:octaprenyl-diphosphate synthase
VLEKVTEKIDEIVSELQNESVKSLFVQVSGGKMLRPRLMLKISQNERIYELAAIVELIHIASLLHDDVIDASLLRRKKPTVNATEGDRTAVMMGDILYSKAFSKLVSFEQNIAYKVSNAVTLLSLGELEDVQMSNTLNTDEAAYIEMLYKKTGSLIEAAAVSAAMLEGIESSGIEVYAKSLGVAFQLIDDILDITADEAALGKKPFSDFADGKTTVAYMHLYKNGDDAIRAFLESIYKKEMDENQKAKLLAEFQKHGSIEYSLELAKQITEDGLKALQNSNIDEALKNALTETAKNQLSRLF